MKRFVGFLLLLVAIGIVVAFKVMQSPDATDVVRVVGLVGSEKITFLDNPEVISILRRKYGIDVQAKKSGSVEMVQAPANDLDFLWPADQTNVDMYRKHGGQPAKVESIFHSPLVMYSWRSVVDALIERQIIEQRDTVYYLTEPKQLFDLIVEGATWKDLGLNQLFGKVNIRSTDPLRSNSGNMYAALLADVLNGEPVATSEQLEPLLPKIQNVFARQGYMEESSGVLFSLFVEQGEGAYPIIVGYENQIVEFSALHKESLPVIRDRLRILYPQPTVWSNHPLMALNENGKRLLEALQDPDIMRIAWSAHGFRAGDIGAKSAPDLLEVPGLPASITSVVPVPSAPIMERIATTLQRE
ncbi:MAG: hypothetical protein KDA92_01610 [Planctomycetales bacterium]|nr:hypothetical protein [Planctomycetales bacterium]MCA9166651.1 hypothetical protein [Planctomycetales bacterium]